MTSSLKNDWADTYIAIFVLVPGNFWAKQILIQFPVRRKNEKDCFGTIRYSNKFLRVLLNDFESKYKLQIR